MMNVRQLLGLVFISIAGIMEAADRPNILFCISDDQSYEHTGANGDPVVQTPAFDRIAKSGLRFEHAFCDAPTCGPSRSAILTGQSIWRLEEAGNIHSTLPAKFATYTELLQKAGYRVGYTGKGWSPGRLEPGGRTENPAGQNYVGRKLKQKIAGISDDDYAANFEDFMTGHPEGKPFCFWLGTREPHRGYKLGAGIASGKDPAKVVVPPFFPDNDVVRSDILDYYMEVEHYDRMVERAVQSLEKRGLLENTIVVITSDHGMPFPRAKASLYDQGSRVPLAISWPNGIKKPGRTVESFVNLSDLSPTFLEAAGINPPEMMSARSLMDVFANKEQAKRPAAFIAMERHDGCRAGGKGYPCRAIRTKDWLYIHNFEPGRWPSGSPDAGVCARAIPYGEIDTSPTKSYLMDNPEAARFAKLSFDFRPAEELYEIKSDPGNIKNLAGSPKHAKTLQKMRKQLFEHLAKTKDPRVIGGKVMWDYYPYYGRMKNKNWAVDEPETEETLSHGENLELSRSAYHEKLQGFWLGECIANWTGLITEGVKKTQPFYTDKAWGTNQGRKNKKIEFVLVEEGDVWGADDDTDIEYIFQEILLANKTSIATPEQILEGWLRHIKHEEPNFLWVSNERALHLMMDGMLPPDTSLPENNTKYDQIDAQLTTEIFGLFAPGRPDVALKMAHMPIRTTAYRDSEWISEFYVIMHSLASSVDPNLSMKEQTQWLAEQARQRLPNQSFPAMMYDRIKQEYENNPDKHDWEKTRNALNQRHTGLTTDGYNYRSWFDAGINYGASLISLFYGEGDFKRTIQIGALCGWDSDNPTATWGGLLGFMLGREGVEKQFPDKHLSGLYNISRTRINFPDRTPGQPGDDSFVLMADRGLRVINRVVAEEMDGNVDKKEDVWRIPCAGSKIKKADY